MTKAAKSDRVKLTDTVKPATMAGQIGKVVAANMLGAHVKFSPAAASLLPGQMRTYAVTRSGHVVLFVHDSFFDVVD